MSHYSARYLATEPARDEIDAMPGPLLLEFGAPWCGHCLAAQPALQALLAQCRNLATHIKIEDGRGKPLGRSFAVKLWPTLVLMRSGQELVRLVRPVSDADLAPLRDALARI
ncbi:MAG: thioredoxin family protein [Xanthomonadales bacterium]|nr:thioredoxin family protein [Xanthomonadales bacterium]